MDREAYRDLRSILVSRSASGVASLVALAVVFVSYLVLAEGSPGTALLVTSASGVMASLTGTFYVWPMERKITWQRQAEVFGYRVGAGLVAYLVVGLVLIFLVNAFSEKLIPLDWPVGYRRRVPFWPFYVLVVLGCGGPLPAPPDAC